MSPFFSALRLLIDQSIAVFFQVECLLCGDHLQQSGLCKKCSKSSFLIPPLCTRCGLPVSEKIAGCGACPPTIELYDQIRSGLWLKGGDRVRLLRAKFHGEWEWLEVYRPLVSLSVLAMDLPPNTVVVPVPLHRKRLQERGFDQADLLSQWTGLKSLCLIEKVKATEAQSLLSKTERRRNLVRAFRIKKNMPLPPSVLLIDDVFTTGETLSRCARILRKAGIQHIAAWTLFRAPIHSL